MNQKERQAIQRSMARAAVANLRGAGDFFGADDHPNAGEDFHKWNAVVNELERWLFEDSGVA